MEENNKFTLGFISRVLGFSRIISLLLIVLAAYLQNYFQIKSLQNRRFYETDFIDTLRHIAEFVWSNIFFTLVLLIISILTIKLSRNKRDKRSGKFLLTVIIISFLLSVIFGGLFLMSFSQ
ncbi:MAG TPA: hypothetical protein PLQ20_01335 [Candidatus Paceibacterota bacterium]|nr:hypothetical protein [Candidatus Paceibacterota bacterium]